MSTDQTDKVIFQKYIIKRQLSKGSFGLIYLGQNIITKEYVAIKTEEKGQNRNLLQFEYQLLLKLQNESVPKVLFYGDDNTYYYLVEELLGSSLEDLFNLSNHHFSLKTVAFLAIEIIKIIRYLHSKWYLHCDIKPANFMFGINGKEDQLYLIDYGLSNQYINSEDNTHIAFTRDNNLTGTVRYCSINSHLGYQQSRRDDLESIGYMLIYFANGCLPWQGLKLNQNEKWFKTIEKKKMETNERDLCSGLPVQFEEYIKYVKKLDFATEPDYEYLIDLFQTVIQMNGYSYKRSINDFEWNKLNNTIETPSIHIRLNKSTNSIPKENNTINAEVDKLIINLSDSRPSNASGNKSIKNDQTNKKKEKKNHSGGNCQCVIF